MYKGSKGSRVALVIHDNECPEHFRRGKVTSNCVQETGRVTWSCVIL